MTKQEHIKSLKLESNELYSQITILKKFRDFLEEQLAIYEEEIELKENKIEDINNQLDELEGNIWSNNQESQRDYMNDVL